MDEDYEVIELNQQGPSEDMKDEHNHGAAGRLPDAIRDKEDYGYPNGHHTANCEDVSNLNPIAL